MGKEVNRRLSLVAEHLSRKQKVKGSIPLIAFHFFFTSEKEESKKKEKCKEWGSNPRLRRE